MLGKFDWAAQIIDEGHRLKSETSLVSKTLSSLSVRPFVCVPCLHVPCNQSLGMTCDTKALMSLCRRIGGAS